MLSHLNKTIRRDWKRILIMTGGIILACVLGGMGRLHYPITVETILPVALAVLGVAFSISFAFFSLFGKYNQETSPGEENQTLWCPECQEEYREGFSTCADCKTTLVEKLQEPEQPDAPEEDWIGVTLKDRTNPSGPRLMTATLALEAERIPLRRPNNAPPMNFPHHAIRFGNIIDFQIPRRCAGKAKEILGDAFHVSV